MPLRFRRRVSLLPGLRVNLSRSGASLSVGTRGAWYTVGPRGKRVTVGLPGSGLFWTEAAPPAPAVHAGHRLALALLVVAVLGGVYWVTSRGGAYEALRGRAGSEHFGHRLFRGDKPFNFVMATLEGRARVGYFGGNPAGFGPLKLGDRHPGADQEIQ